MALHRVPNRPGGVPVNGRSGVLSTSLPQEHPRERSPLRLGRIRKDGAPRGWLMHQESPPENNSNRLLFLMSNFCGPCVMCLLRNGTGFVARICRFVFS